MMAGRKLSSGELQLVILALLAEQPRHGYDIIKKLEQRSSQFYSPSPGMVYPALTYLEEIGHATVDATGAKKLYQITESGRAHLAENQVTADAILSQLAAIGRKMQAAREFFADDGEDDDLHTASHDLRHAVRGSRHATPEERKRVAEILRRATREIKGS
jgi:DNA-binding PadR family transcriptional regulator